VPRSDEAGYTEIRRLLRDRLLWEKGVLMRGGGLPDPTGTYLWALRLEVLRRLDDAQACGDLPRLRSAMSLALGIISRA
jgi:hypothetical protein